jgi:hypothetical protein
MVTTPGTSGPPSAPLPPPLPNDPSISPVMSNYLNQFSLWCKTSLAGKVNAKTATNNVMFQGYDAPTGANPAPNIYALEVSNAGTACVAPVSLASGALGTPAPIGTGEFLPLTGGALSGQLFANDGVSFGDWGYGGYQIRLDWDAANWGLPLLVNGGYVVDDVSFIPISFSGSGVWTAIRALSLYGDLNAMYVWYNPADAWVFTPSGSDIRLKTNIEPAMKDALAAINSLSVCECDLTLPPAGQAQHWHWSVIADEALAAAIPNSVVPATEHSYATIRELPVIAALIKAVQQLSARVEALER